MARYLDVHPDNPQPRALAQAVAVLQDGGLIAYPTDSGYALGCILDNKQGLERIRAIRELDDKHHFTLMISAFSQVGQWVELDNWMFRLMKANTPGPYTFIVRAGRDVPRLMQQPKKRTVGVRVPEHVTTLALLDALGQPMVSSTLILPGQDQPMADGWQVADELGNQIDLVLDSGDAGHQATTVVNLTGDEVSIDRVGAGDTAPFEVE